MNLSCLEFVELLGCVYLSSDLGSFFAIISSPFSVSSPSGTPKMCVSLHLMISYRSLRLCLCYSFFFFLSHCILPIVLSSDLLIISSSEICCRISVVTFSFYIISVSLLCSWLSHRSFCRFPFVLSYVTQLI